MIAMVLSYEYHALNKNPQDGLLAMLQAKGLISSSFVLDPTPGRALSLWLGYIGFGTLVAMNLYSLRKRVPVMAKFGKLSHWLNFHIFCGLVGPTFILFHCNFKVGGLVSISFWSMAVSFASGIVGRYFYVNLLAERKNAKETSEFFWQKYLRQLKRNQMSVEDPMVDDYREYALSYVGYSEAVKSPLGVLLNSIAGDIRCILRPPPTIPDLHPDTAYILEAFAVNYRKANTLEAFQRLMGYWHAFHKPFAVFMYAVAVIHIISAMFFGV